VRFSDVYMDCQISVDPRQERALKALNTKAWGNAPGW